MLPLFSTLLGYVVFALAVLHALLDGRANRIQRLLLLLSLLVYGALLEGQGVKSGHYFYPPEPFVNLGPVPLSVSLAWVGIIYSVMVIAGRMRLPAWLYLLTTTSLALSLDWGMDPIATARGFWVWRLEGTYLGVPTFNMLGWFFIPICYLVAYGLAWDRERRRVRLLCVQEVDADRSWWRRLYTLVLTTPLALWLLLFLTRDILRHIPFMRRFDPLVMAAWMVLTVTGTFELVVWRREWLRRSRWVDLLPPGILSLIALSYIYFALEVGESTLAALMLVTAAPLWAAFVFTLRRGSPVNTEADNDT